MKETAGIAVKSGNKLLICQRSDDGSWAIPMGHMEEGETPLECAYREFYEETNLEITDKIKYLGRIKNLKKGRVKKIMHIFLFETDSKIQPDLNKAMDGYEHTECNYYTRKEIEDLNMIESLKKFILKIIF
jgi:8-oxo-dGTP pyrophosphatase MutT (NUDIX family)